jgi:hypothetical protein
VAVSRVLYSTSFRLDHKCKFWIHIAINNVHFCCIQTCNFPDCFLFQRCKLG